MTRFLRLAAVLFTASILTAAVSTTVAFAQSTKAALRNSDVIKMVKAKLQESTILMTVRSSPSDFDISSEALIKLKEAGVSTNLIEAMIQASNKQPSAQAPSVTSSPPGTVASAQPTVIPVIAGPWGAKQTRIDADRVFLIDGDNRTEMKFTQPATRTRWVFAVQQFAALNGTKARFRIQNRSPDFEMILPNNVEPSSVVALGLLAERPNGTREILIGGGYMSISHGLPRDRNIGIAIERTADQSGAPEGYEIYRIRPSAPLQSGEYAFMVSKPSGGTALAGAGFNYTFYDVGVD